MVDCQCSHPLMLPLKDARKYYKPCLRLKTPKTIPFSAALNLFTPYKGVFHLRYTSSSKHMSTKAAHPRCTLKPLWDHGPFMEKKLQ